jgi:hypothetical protein
LIEHPGAIGNRQSGESIMGFWNGRVTFTRYRISGNSPLPFDQEVLDLAAKHQIGAHQSPDPVDGITTGWAGGEHVLDLTFDHGKNGVDDALHLSIRIDTDKIPGPLLRAYTQIETDARAQLNESGKATKAQKLEAKEAAKARAEAEAADGRFRRLNHYPVLWDGQSNTLYVGSASTSVLDRIQALFRETFDRTLEPVTAGGLARALAPADPKDPTQLMGNLGRGPLTLVGNDDGETASVSWAESDTSSLDYLGNEFLVWIWHTLQNDTDSIDLSDGSDVAVMLAKTLTLDCPKGETGRDQLTDDSPARLPEALRALQAGKLPRKAGMVLVRHGAQYELTLQAETLSVSGAALPKSDEQQVSDHEKRIARLQSLRHLSQTLDLLYEAYLSRRNGSGWNEELRRIRQWLQAA